MNAKVRMLGDGGVPEKIFTDADDYVRDAIDQVVANTAGQISIRSERQAAVPTLSIE